MKYSKTLIFLAVLISTTIGFHSCKFLNVNDYFEETLKYDSVFHNKRNIERYMWGVAAKFPDEGAIFGNNYTPGIFASDEGFNLYYTSEFHGIAYVLGEVTPTNLYDMNIWDRMYQIIRSANTIMIRMDEAPDLDAIDKREILGYVLFIRAYAYYHLLMAYGPVVLLGDDLMETNAESEYYNRARATYDESVEYICAELERASEYLPPSQPVSYFGRPTQGAAFGLIARLRLQHASPLYNGGDAARKYFDAWKRKTDGVHYIQQTPNENRWATAAYAAKRIIDLNRYSLFYVERGGDAFPLPANVPTEDFPDGAGNVDAFRSYSDMFTGEALAARNPEFIWARMSEIVKTYSRHAFPVVQMGGWNGLSVTQKVVDAYRMVDGCQINNSSSEYPYLTDGFLGGANKIFSGYTLRGDGNVHNMYVNREMRFYACIGFSGCHWTANSTSSNDRKNRNATYWTDGNSGKTQTDNNPRNYPITGYVCRKYVHADDAWAGDNQQRLDKSYPIIRYAEILLAYVEALNNITGTITYTDPSGETHTFSRNTDEMRKYFNQVRFRVGLPGPSDAELNSRETMQKLIEQERMIEFMFEGHRYYDVRRWGIYEETEREPFMGMNTDAPKSDYFSIVPLNHSRARSRIVDKKLIFLPIHLDEIRKASLLDQNPGWQN
ncbi:MAG: RagB/SusD family nutrient uptake outer membrane protein [Prevotellaceae bacterium]|jgi:hypothetical protein|nr:RagB/SusD family nutrient uptake outer membrane protein [Prevotellaceae bacterium]